MQEIRSLSKRLRSVTPDRLTLSGKFLIIWSIRVADWSVTLVGLNIIFSGKCVKQNPKYNLVRWGISLLIVFADFCLKISLFLSCKLILASPRRNHSWDSKTLMSLNVRILGNLHSVLHFNFEGKKSSYCFLIQITQRNVRKEKGKGIVETRNNGSHQLVCCISILLFYIINRILSQILSKRADF